MEWYFKVLTLLTIYVSFIVYNGPGEIVPKDKAVGFYVVKGATAHMRKMVEQGEVNDLPSAHREFLLKYFDRPIDPLVSGTPSYLVNKVLNSPGGEDLKDHVMFKENVTNGYVRIKREPGETIPFGSGWHTDLSYLGAKQLPVFSSIIGIHLHNNRTKTQFKDMRQVLSMWEHKNGKVDPNATAIHTDGVNIHTQNPVVRTVPGAGRVLWVNQAFVKDDGHGGELLRFIDDHGTVEEAKWTIDDMLIWDNRIMQHRTDPEYPRDQYREIQRIITN